MSIFKGVQYKVISPFDISVGNVGYSMYCFMYADIGGKRRQQSFPGQQYWTG